ncbi:hypothetical protein SAMN05920897_12029 [Alkalispirochaeta americana]|uniref:Uncharacterized protein n=2 Tax=Alkalispirochaeta americana TaxID=159291 RepID=A0A1N6X4Z2_9SPIO|nr:hypothetical protein SAMN05920897_12029 [Alkalispirochaeta americana]
MERLTFRERLKLWMSGLFRAGGQRERFVALRLSQARQRVREHSQDMADFEGRRFLPGLPREIRALCRAAEPLSGFFSYIWYNPSALRTMLDYLLARRIPDAKNSLEQLCPLEELQETFRETESPGKLKQTVLERLSKYVESIPDAVIDELEGGMKPLYLFKDLVLFDYDSFFALFRSSRVEAVSEDDISFGNAPVSTALERIEELYLALHYCSRVEGEPSMYGELLHAYCALRQETEPGTPLEDIPPFDEEKVLQRNLLLLAREASRLRDSVPLQDMIRFFRTDPYYRFMAYTPRLRLREFYYANLKIKMLDQLDQRFQELRKGALDTMIRNLFPRGLSSFEYFSPEVETGIARSGVAELRVHRSLQFIFTFLQRIFHDDLSDFLRILSRMMPSRNRSNSVDISLFAASLEDLEQRLRAFDISFSPDSDEGKTFYRYRFGTADRDASQLNAYRALIQQKNRDARETAEKFQELLQGIRARFLSLRRGSMTQMNERYRNFDPAPGEDRPFETRLDRSVKVLESTQNILAQLILLESGSGSS